MPKSTKSRMAFVSPFGARGAHLSAREPRLSHRPVRRPRPSVRSPAAPPMAPVSMAQSPGFDIKNNTQFPVQVSLSQVGPLYWEIVAPGAYFRRRTGAVWFTINATTYFEGVTDKITAKDAILPIAEVTVTALAAAFTGGTAAVARAGAQGAVRAGAKGVARAGLGRVAALARNKGLGALSAAMVNAGVPPTYALAIGGAVVAGGETATKEIIKQLLVPENVDAKNRGEYAGPPWPFRAELRPQYEINGGLRVEKTVVDGEEVANITASPLVIQKVKTAPES